jgi:hypothetical protein
MSVLRGEGFTAYDQGDQYFVLLDGPLTPEQRDIAAARAVEALRRRTSDEEATDIGAMLRRMQRKMREAIYGGLDL